MNRIIRLIAIFTFWIEKSNANLMMARPQTFTLMEKSFKYICTDIPDFQLTKLNFPADVDQNNCLTLKKGGVSFYNLPADTNSVHLIFDGVCDNPLVLGVDSKSFVFESLKFSGFSFNSSFITVDPLIKEQIKNFQISYHPSQSIIFDQNIEEKGILVFCPKFDMKDVSFLMNTTRTAIANQTMTLNFTQFLSDLPYIYFEVPISKQMELRLNFINPTGFNADVKVSSKSSCSIELYQRIPHDGKPALIVQANSIPNNELNRDQSGSQFVLTKMIDSTIVRTTNFLVLVSNSGSDDNRLIINATGVLNRSILNNEDPSLMSSGARFLIIFFSIVAIIIVVGLIVIGFNYYIKGNDLKFQLGYVSGKGEKTVAGAPAQADVSGLRSQLQLNF